MTEDYRVLVPAKYQAFKDDTPNLFLNDKKHPGTDEMATLPRGHEYDVPLSLNAEVCMSEFRNVETKKPAPQNA